MIRLHHATLPYASDACGFDADADAGFRHDGCRLDADAA